MPHHQDNRLQKIDAIDLADLINEINAAKVFITVFDDGWYWGWCLKKIDNPHPDGSDNEWEWARGYRQGKRDRRTDDG